MKSHQWNYNTRRCIVCGRSEFKEAHSPTLCFPRPEIRAANSRSFNKFKTRKLCLP